MIILGNIREGKNIKKSDLKTEKSPQTTPILTNNSNIFKDI